MQLSYQFLDLPVGQLKLVAHEPHWWLFFGKMKTRNRVRLAALVEDLKHPIC